MTRIGSTRASLWCITGRQYVVMPSSTIFSVDFEFFHSHIGEHRSSLAIINEYLSHDQIPDMDKCVFAAFLRPVIQL